MADWNKKYYFSFKDVEDVNYTVEIWEDIPDGSPLPVPALIQGDLNPATLEYPGSYLFTPVRASGAVLTLLSTSDRMFNNLFTREMLKYQVRVYKTVWITPIYSIESPVWLGFLDSENYSEPFDSLTNYPVQVTANDGFNLLGRMSYINYNSVLGTYTKLTGINSAWEVLLRVLQRLNLPWTNIYVGLSTTIPDVTIAANENLLEKLYLNNENWYNEDGEPETCRTVLENLLAILSAFIVQIGGDLYITDRQHLSTGATASFKKYTYGYETTAYSATVSVSINNGDISTVGLQSSRVSMLVETGINKQVVTYSPYFQKRLIDYEALGDFSNPTGSVTIGDTGYSWTETEYADSATWTKYNNGKFCSYVGAEAVNAGNKDTYLKIENYGLTGLNYYNQTGDETKHSFKCNVPQPTLISTGTYYLRVQMSVYARTIDNMGDSPTLGIKSVNLVTRLKIGNKKFKGGAFYDDPDFFKWTDLTDTSDLTLFFRDTTDGYANYPLNDKWFNLDMRQEIGYFQDGVFKNGVLIKPYLIPLEGIEGPIEFDIYGYRVYDESTDIWTEVEIPELRIKDIVLSITDKDGKEIDLTDIEYTSKLDKNFSNSGQPVKSLLGCNLEDYPIERGNLLLDAGDTHSFLTEATRNGVTDIPEKLLLRSIKSNYAEPNIQLTLETSTQTNQIGYFTYSSYLSGKKLAILSNKINLSENVSQLTLRDFHNDFATITE